MYLGTALDGQSPNAMLCSCGCVYPRDVFKRLPLVGAQETGDAGSFMEVRRCTCGSTLSRGPLTAERHWMELSGLLAEMLDEQKKTLAAEVAEIARIRAKYER